MNLVPKKLRHTFSPLVCSIFLVVPLYLPAQLGPEGPLADTCDAKRVYKSTAVDDPPEIFASVDQLERELTKRLHSGDEWSGRVILFLVINCYGEVAAMELRSDDIPDRVANPIRQYLTREVRWRPARNRSHWRACADRYCRVDCVYSMNIQIEGGRVNLRALRRRRGM